MVLCDFNIYALPFGGDMVYVCHCPFWHQFHPHLVYDSPTAYFWSLVSSLRFCAFKSLTLFSNWWRAASSTPMTQNYSQLRTFPFLESLFGAGRNLLVFEFTPASTEPVNDFQAWHVRKPWNCICKSPCKSSFEWQFSSVLTWDHHVQLPLLTSIRIAHNFCSVALTRNLQLFVRLLKQHWFWRILIN